MKEIQQGRLFMHANICILIFDLNDYQTFDSLIYWEELIRKKYDYIQVMLIGNKGDLHQKVNDEEIIQFIKKWPKEYPVEFYKISAVKPDHPGLTSPLELKFRFLRMIEQAHNPTFPESGLNKSEWMKAVVLGNKNVGVQSFVRNYFHGPEYSIHWDSISGIVPENLHLETAKILQEITAKLAPYQTKLEEAVYSMMFECNFEKSKKILSSLLDKNINSGIYTQLVIDIHFQLALAYFYLGKQDLCTQHLNITNSLIDREPRVFLSQILQSVSLMLEIATSKSDIDLITQNHKYLQNLTDTILTEIMDEQQKSQLIFLTRYSKALSYLVSNRMRQQMMADTILREMIDQGDYMDNNKLNLIPHIIEILINEWKAYDHPDIKDEILYFIDKGEDFLNKIPSDFTLVHSQGIDFKILRAKIQLIQGNFEEASSLYNEALSLSKKYNMNNNKLRVLSLIRNLKEEYQSIKKLANSKSMKEIFERSAISDYLSQAKSLLAQQQQDLGPSTIQLADYGVVNICCNQTARLQEKYCGCGRAVPADLLMYYDIN
ncbi:MAG: hypothetical protein INQ03_23925 [Candidatus Heimdallarchaeota archaeon]|nr:hypothetical protein [Candidatus Heimdallarchaeota archaeon]